MIDGLQAGAVIGLVWAAATAAILYARQVYYRWRFRRNLDKVRHIAQAGDFDAWFAAVIAVLPKDQAELITREKEDLRVIYTGRMKNS